MATFTPSKYQQAIYDWVRTGTGNAVVEAVAGSGKTTTLLEALNLMTGSPLFCAFNKHIKDELAARAPKHAKVSTIHSLGFSTVRKAFPLTAVNGKKLQSIVREIMGEEFNDREARVAAERLASVAKLTLTDPTPENLSDLMAHHDIEANGETDWVIESVPEILEECVKRAEHEIDFDDQVWLPHRLNLKPRGFDWVCVDEAQDLNSAQRELVLKAGRGRVMAVGDSRQAIYGFAGADTSSIARITERLNAKTLPLSICYRCPSSHLDMAREIVPHIEARAGAPVGTIDYPSLDALTRILVDGDLIICRVNAPLAEIAMRLVRQGKKAVLRGRDLSSNLQSLIRRVAKRRMTIDMAVFLDALVDYREKETRKLYAAEKDGQAESLRDRVDTLIALSDGTDTVDDLSRRVNEIFTDSKDGIVCSSVHRAKGLEAKRVGIFEPRLMPHPRARSGWEMEQEYNLKYVALTRSKDTLWMVGK